jgi:hypothetical protein
MTYVGKVRESVLPRTSCLLLGVVITFAMVMRCSWILDLVGKHDSVCWNHSNTVKGFWASVDNIYDNVWLILSIFPPLLTGKFLLLRNEEVSDLYRPTSVVRTVTCSSLGWTGHMARAWETWIASGARRPCNGCKRRLHLQIK